MARKPPAGESALRQRQKERADLKSQDILWIGLAASETNIQRLAAYLMFAEHPIQVEVIKDGPMPWEDPNDPRFQKPPELEIDYEVVRRSIIRNLTAFSKAQMVDKAKEILAAFGATKLSEVPQERLIDVNAALEAELKAKEDASD